MQSKKFMTVTDTDQAQTTEGTESGIAAVEETAEVTDNQATEDEGQSNNTEEGKTEETVKLYKLPDGREVSAEDLHKEYAEKLLPEFTRKSQKLAAFEKAEAERKAESEAVARKASEEALKGVPADVKEAIIQVVKPLFKQQMDELAESNRLKEEEKTRTEADTRFKTELSNLEKKYNGRNADLVGIPKFDAAEVLKAMQKPDNKIFDPEVKFMDMHRAKFLDLEVRRALKAQKGGNNTEKTGTTATADRGTKSTATTPKTLSEASQSFLNRMASKDSE